jgi:hypothetical protein
MKTRTLINKSKKTYTFLTSENGIKEKIVVTFNNRIEFENAYFYTDSDWKWYFRRNEATRQLLSSKSKLI